MSVSKNNNQRFINELDRNPFLRKKIERSLDRTVNELEFYLEEIKAANK